MESAISIKTGEHIEAKRLAGSVAYRAALKHLLVCPECGEPVHFKSREVPYNTPFFAHYKQVASIKAIRVCSLRTFGAVFEPASATVPGIKHGQLVDRFQREFCKALHDSFGRYSSSLYSFVEQTGQQSLSAKAYATFVSRIEELADFRAVSREDVSRQEAWLQEATQDVCLFLRSGYGKWVGEFIHHVARFVAAIAHPDVDEQDFGRCVFCVGNRRVAFVAEPFRLKDAVDIDRRASSRRDRIHAQVAATLVAFLVLKWRVSTKVVGLLGVAESIERETGKRAPPTVPRLTKDEASRSSQSSDPAVGDDPLKQEWPRPGSSSPPPPTQQPHAQAGSPVPIRIWAKTPPPPQEVMAWVARSICEAVVMASRQGPINEPKGFRSARSDEHRPPSAPAAPVVTYKRAASTMGERQVSTSDLGAGTGSSVDVDMLRPSASLSSDDQRRILQLVSEAKSLGKPDHRLFSRVDVQNWSNKKNPIDAYFLAGFLDIVHEPPQFVDPTLTAKLAAWLKWAKQAR